MKNLILAALIALSSNSQAQTRTNNKVMAFNRAEGAAVYESYAQNQSFDKSTFGCTAISGSSPTVTTSLALIGKGSIQFSGTANTDQWRCRTKAFPTIVDATKQQGAGLNGQNCQVKFIYSSAYGGPVTQSEFTGYIANSAGTNISGTQTLSGTYDIANPQAGRTGLFFFPCPYNATAANAYVDLIISHTTGTNSSLVMDEFMPTFAEDIGQGVPNNTFSAKFSNTGVVSDSNQSGWASNATVSDTSLFTIPISGFNVAPNCTVSISVNDNTTSITSKIESITATSIGVRTGWSNTANSFTKSAQPFILNCTKAGSDFIQPTITPNQATATWSGTLQGGTDWTTTSSTNVDLNTGAAGSITTRVSTNFAQPTQYSTNGLGIVWIPPNTATYEVCASLRRWGAAAQNANVLMFDGANNQMSHSFIWQQSAQDSTPICGFVKAIAGVSTTTKIRGSITGGSTLTVGSDTAWTIKQIDGTYPAPILTGSVTSNVGGAWRIEEAAVYTVCTSSPCTISTQTGGISNITRTSAGIYTINFSSAWTNTPQCFWNIANPNSVATAHIRADGDTTTYAGGYAYNTNGSAVMDVGFKVFCFGPR